MENISAELDKTINNFFVTKQDRETLKSILQNADEKNPPTIYWSLTYLTTNYITLTHLFNLAKICRFGCELVVSLWDMNMLSNPYFKKIEFEKYQRPTYEQYIKQKKDEVRALTAALGIQNVKIFASSELWIRFMQQKEPALFSQYYSTISTIDLDEIDINEKLHYLVQLPADLFFANFFHILFAEDAKKSIDILYGMPERKSLYFVTRKAMHSEGLVSTEKPVLMLPNNIPRIEIDAQIPQWDLTQNEIYQLIALWQFSPTDLEALYQNVFGLILPEVTLVTAKGEKTVETKNASKYLVAMNRENAIFSITKNFFEYFKKARELVDFRQEPKPDFYNIKTRKETQQIASLLKSKNALQILALANGNRTVTEIAKETNMQLSNASQYITKLRKAGLIAIREKKVNRTARGIKINFEATLTA